MANAKRVLMIVSNPSKNILGWPVGFWGCELTHPYWEFTETGYEVDIASPLGGKVELDSWSDPHNSKGYEVKDLVTLGFLHNADLAAKLAATPKLADLGAATYDLVYLVGGQAPIYTFREDASVQAALRSAFEANKFVAAICHGVAGLLDVKLSNGEYLIKDKVMTGFSNIEEDDVEREIKAKTIPYRIEDVAKARGAKFVAEGLWRSYAVRDGNLVTGQQSFSARSLAKLLIETLGR